MKTITTCICITLLMAISLTSGASDLAELYPEKIKQAKNIYPLAEKFFKGPKAIAEGETITLEILKNPERQQAHYKLQHLIGLAIDAGIDLSHLSEFGVIKEGDNKYVLDYRINPGLISNTKLFVFFNKPHHILRNAQRLESLGLSETDIQRLNDYVKTNDPYVQMNIAERDYLQNQKQRLNQKHSPERITLHDILDIHEHSNRMRDKIWNKWAIGLLDNLSTYKQRILVEYLQQSRSNTILLPAPINKDYLVSFEQKLRSGQIVDTLNKSINQSQEQ